MDRRSFLRSAVATTLTSWSASAVLANTLAPEGVFGEAQARPRAPAEKVLFMTMDDGYQHVDTVLASTRETHMPVTFFPTGEALLAHPDQWRTLIEDGHELGCHTFSHPEASLLNENTFRAELHKWIAAATRVFGQAAVDNVRYFRYPYGDTGRDHKAAFRQIVNEEFGWQVIGWDLCLDDIFPHGTAPHRTPQDFGRGLIQHARPNDIVLMHFVTPDAFSLVELYARASEHGFVFKPLSEHPDTVKFGAVAS